MEAETMIEAMTNQTLPLPREEDTQMKEKLSAIETTIEAMKNQTLPREEGKEMKEKLSAIEGKLKVMESSQVVRSFNNGSRRMPTATVFSCRRKSTLKSTSATITYEDCYLDTTRGNLNTYYQALH